MRTIIMAFGWVMCISSIQAQYTYFNILTGEPDDLESQSTTNMEVVEAGYVVWGSGVDDGVLFHFVRKYDFSGNVTFENNLIFPGEYLYAGLVNSFRYNPHNNEFVMVQGSGMDGTLRGRMLRFDENLELIDSRYYDQYSPYTYFFGAMVEVSSYVIYGEDASASNSGTFLMKMDFQGNPIWTQTMQPRIQGYIYRNWSGLPLDNGGYLVAGGGRTGGGLNATESFGRLTLLDSLGNTLSEIDYEDEDAPQTKSFTSMAKLSNGEILIGNRIAYEHDETTSDPDAFWHKLRLLKFDPATEEFYEITDFFDNYAAYTISPVDMLPTSDGGAVISGGVGYQNIMAIKTWLMKVDSELNMEWYQEYAYEDCSNCQNQLWDLEAAPDGGYVLAGWFTNWDIDPRNSTWLLKVDACGEVEWQGCEPLGIGDAINPGDRAVVYPNPASERISIKPPVTKTLASYEMFDMTEKRVAGRSNGGAVDVSSLAPGLYVLQLTYRDGSVESHKVEVVR